MIATSFVVCHDRGHMLLALRFKVFILIPGTLLAAALIVASSHQPKQMIALTVVGAVALLQIGYIVGMIARALLQRRSMASCDDSFLKSIEGFISWRVVGASVRFFISGKGGEGRSDRRLNIVPLQADCVAFGGVARSFGADRIAKPLLFPNKPS
jgi:nitrate reductase gamma subunit